MKKSIKGLVLNIVLLTASVTMFHYLFFWEWIAIPLILFIVLYTVITKGVEGLIDLISGFCYAGAFLIDCMGNVLLQVPLNVIFVKPGGHRYGKLGESISQATGWNIKDNTATTQQVKFSNALSFVFGKDHCINSLKGNMNG